MESLHVKALLAGIFFGIWPLFMNKSGLPGNVSAFVFCLIVTVFMVPFVATEYKAVTSVSWAMVITAGLFGTLGFISFNGMLAKATPLNIGTLIVLMIVAQTIVASGYQAYMAGGITVAKVSGFVLAGIACVLLTKG